jgi:hypothetical protein
MAVLDTAGLLRRNRGVKHSPRYSIETVEKRKTSIDFTYRQGLYTTVDVEVRATGTYCYSSVAEME